MADQTSLSTPLPDDDLIHLVVGHRDRQSFEVSRRLAVNVIVNILEERGIQIERFRRILDFGCGCGRILAGWEGILQKESELFGCDLNEELVKFCQGNIKYASVIQSAEAPPLPFDDGFFDFVYAASVFTHMGLPDILKWTGELTRIIKQSGIAMITIHGSYYHERLADLSKDGFRHLEERGYFTYLHTRADETWKGSNAYATFASVDFMRRIFAGFDLIGAFPGRSYGPTPFVSYQDVLVFVRS